MTSANVRSRSCLKPQSREGSQERNAGSSRPVTPKKVEFAVMVEVKKFGDTPEMTDLSKALSTLLTPSNKSGDPGTLTSLTPDLIRESKLNFGVDSKQKSDSWKAAASKFRFKNIFPESTNTSTLPLAQDAAAVQQPRLPVNKNEPPTLPSVKVKARSSAMGGQTRPTTGITRKSPMPRAAKPEAVPVHNTRSRSKPTPFKETNRNRRLTMTPRPRPKLHTPTVQEEDGSWLSWATAMDQENTPFTAWLNEKSTRAQEESSSSIGANTTFLECSPSKARASMKQEIESIDFKRLSKLGKVSALHNLSSQLQKLDDNDFSWALGELEQHLQPHVLQSEVEKRNSIKKQAKYPATTWSKKKRLSRSR